MRFLKCDLPYQLVVRHICLSAYLLFKLTLPRWFSDMFVRCRLPLYMRIYGIKQEVGRHTASVLMAELL